MISKQLIIFPLIISKRLTKEFGSLLLFLCLRATCFVRTHFLPTPCMSLYTWPSKNVLFRAIHLSGKKKDCEVRGACAPFLLCIQLNSKKFLNTLPSFKRVLSCSSSLSRKKHVKKWAEGQKSGRKGVFDQKKLPKGNFDRGMCVG